VLYEQAGSHQGQAVVTVSADIRGKALFLQSLFYERRNLPVVLYQQHFHDAHLTPAGWQRERGKS
jgi:hypothetical protein